MGVRELWQHAIIWLRRVRGHTSVRVPKHERSNARLVPGPSQHTLEALTATGRVSLPEGDLLDMGAPIPPLEGEPLPSELLRAARDLER
jgi:antitoxin (DNA-binding transcriptional repressor) of toxin-antitoxin stability system